MVKQNAFMFHKNKICNLKTVQVHFLRWISSSPCFSHSKIYLMMPLIELFILSLKYITISNKKKLNKSKSIMFTDPFTCIYTLHAPEPYEHISIAFQFFEFKFISSFKINLNHLCLVQFNSNLNGKLPAQKLG